LLSKMKVEARGCLTKDDLRAFVSERVDMLAKQRSSTPGRQPSCGVATELDTDIDDVDVRKQSGTECNSSSSIEATDLQRPADKDAHTGDTVAATTAEPPSVRVRQTAEATEYPLSSSLRAAEISRTRAVAIPATASAIDWSFSMPLVQLQSTADVWMAMDLDHTCHGMCQGTIIQPSRSIAPPEQPLPLNAASKIHPKASSLLQPSRVPLQVGHQQRQEMPDKLAFENVD